MKKNKIVSVIIATAVLLTTVLYIGIVVVSAAGGDSDDPIVTKSYVDKADAVLDSKINTQNTNQTNALNAAQAANSSKYITRSAAEEIAKNAASSAVKAYADSLPQGTYGYSVISLKANSTLTGSEGLEFIIRNGIASVESSSSSVGVYDMTSGTFIGNTGLLEPNHYFILQREGRKVLAKTDCDILVRGNYKIS
ncbi:MAG: hypothetical protein RR436_06145 [Clostridia bacterium]